MTNPPGKTGVYSGAFRLAFGVLSVALAIGNGSKGDVAFASASSRVAFGAIGGVIALLGVRGLLRALRGYRWEVTRDSLRRVRMYGWAMFLIGLWYQVVAWSDGVVRLGVGLDRWAGPVYGIGGIFLMLQGLVLQIDPTWAIRKTRVNTGEGTRATATVLHASDLGTLRGLAKAKIEMSVDVDGDVTHRSVKTLIDRGRLARIEGATVDVVVDRADPTVFDVKWDTLREAPGVDG